MKFRRYRSRFRKYRPMKPHKPLPFRYVCLLTFVFFLLSTSIGLWIVNKGIKPTFIAYAESQSVNLATYVMNKAIEEEIGKGGLSLENITKVISYENGTQTIFDTEKIIEISTKITSNVLKHINGLEHDHTFSTGLATEGEINQLEVVEGEGLKFKVPFGRITNNVLLGGIGPDIPVSFHAIGDIQYNYETISEPQEINSTWYEIRLHMEVGIQMIVPFTSEMKIIPRDVILASGIIKGEVPQFYGSGGQLTPSIVVPNDEDQEDKKE
ncbi:sporulation protein YunB [Caldibacillus lycopersici]|uniref:Sporulation protein YunB n=1 Tax=Perspicuibacillus lycopersici TaxID=1325689 RepID=A0AAE3IQR4_9BACI|nr:sporulation protein YunB [Perspicuibacillus lycopersici]MCU9612833.1 sporulation protein YunB [Perspicuibacillus lycopersici]